MHTRVPRAATTNDAVCVCVCTMSVSRSYDDNDDRMVYTDVVHKSERRGLFIFICENRIIGIILACHDDDDDADGFCAAAAAHYGCGITVPTTGTTQKTCPYQHKHTCENAMRCYAHCSLPSARVVYCVQMGRKTRASFIPLIDREFSSVTIQTESTKQHRQQ